MNKALGLCAALSLAAVIAGQSTTPASAQETTLGERLYMEYCAVCHGSNANGAGEFGQYLTIVPPSLTTLSKENDGVFPLLQVIRIIDGRIPVRAHAGGDMPIWGNTFSRMASPQLSETSDRELLINMRITALADYLEGLQEQ